MMCGIFGSVFLIPYCFSYDGWNHAAEVFAGAGCRADVSVSEDMGDVCGYFVDHGEACYEERGAFYLGGGGLDQFEVSAEGYAYGVGVSAVGVGSYGAVGAPFFYCAVFSDDVVVADSCPAVVFVGGVGLLRGYVGIFKGACVVDYYCVCFFSCHVEFCVHVEKCFFYHEFPHFIFSFQIPCCDESFTPPR